MNPTREKISRKFIELSQRLWVIRRDLRALEEYCEHDMDRLAIDRIDIDLVWAAENTTVISLHILSEALQDTMGFEY